MRQKATQSHRNALFERLWTEHFNDDKSLGSKYQKISEQMTAELGCIVTCVRRISSNQVANASSESALKHLRPRMKLPGIYRKDTGEQASYDHDIEGRASQPDGDLPEPLRSPRRSEKRRLKPNQGQHSASKQTRARRATSSVVPQQYVQNSINLSQEIRNRRRRSTSDRDTERPDTFASLQPDTEASVDPLRCIGSTNGNVFHCSPTSGQSLQPTL